MTHSLPSTDLATPASTHKGSGTRTYATWSSMVRRCTVPSDLNWRRYGGRGISVCDRWRSFVAFREDMGERPPERTLDRIDPRGNYEPGNCRWATLIEQNNNRTSSVMVPAFGEAKTLAMWARDPRCLVPYRKLNARVARGMPLESAMTTGRMRRGRPFRARE